MSENWNSESPAAASGNNQLELSQRQEQLRFAAPTNWTMTADLPGDSHEILNRDGSYRARQHPGAE